MTQTLEQTVGRQFDEAESRFAPMIRSTDARVRGVLRHLGDIDGRRVLDVGCGKGRFMPWIESRGACAVGVDLSWRMLRAGRHAASAAGGTEADDGRLLIRGSVSRLPIASESFDALYGVEVLSHLPGPAAALAEFHRVLRPGGRIVLLDKNRWSLNHARPYLPNSVVKWIDERRGLWMYPHGFPFRERWFSAPGVRRLLGEHFVAVRSEHLLSGLEQVSPGRSVFCRWPVTRHFVVWSAFKSKERCA